MELVQVFVIQCKSTGKFLTSMLNHTSNLERAGHSYTKQAAVDTGFLELDIDFVVYDFYLPASKTHRVTGAGSLDPHL